MERLGVSIEKSNRMRVGAERETFTTMVAYKGGKEERQVVKTREAASHIKRYVDCTDYQRHAFD